jgi:sugar phosphate isomerase/epimerase
LTVWVSIIEAMLKPAFSTVACPEWTLDRVALTAQRVGFAGVDLRTFGLNSRQFANDPALTDPAKIRRIFDQAGVSVCCVSTDCHFGDPVVPPVIGHFISDTEVEIRRAQQAIDIAESIEAPFVRVFGFRLPAEESRTLAVRRVVERLKKVIDHADKKGVRVVIENGGSFATSQQLIELLSDVNSNLLRASYNVLPAFMAGEKPSSGAAALASKGYLPVLRVKDVKAGRPTLLGSGDVPVRDAIVATAKMDAWCIFEWDRAWLKDVGEPEFALDHASRTMWQWIGQATGNGQKSGGSTPAAAMAHAHH